MHVTKIVASQLQSALYYLINIALFSMGQGSQNSIRGPNSITKYGPIGTLSMGFLISYLTPDLDNIMHEYCYWTMPLPTKAPPDKSPTDISLFQFNYTVHDCCCSTQRQDIVMNILQACGQFHSEIGTDP